MSHLVSIATQCHDTEIIGRVCDKLGLISPYRGTAEMYSGQEATGTIVQLKGWKYPVVFDDAGNAHYDNFNGNWGKQEHLDKFLHEYGVEKLKKEARAKGLTVTEREQADGSTLVICELPAQADGSTPTIEAAVDKAGQVTLQTKGFTGSACLAASHDLEQALGKVSGQQLTSEFYAPQQATDGVSQHQE